MYDRAQLAALDAVVGTGSFEAAARALEVTPSAVSQRVRALERSAGAVLVRRTRPCAATEHGERLVRLARQVAALEADLDDTPPTSLPVAVNADSVATWFPAALARAAARTDVALDVHVDDETRTADLLRAGRVTAAVTCAPRPVQGCRSVVLGALRYRAVAAPSLLATAPDPGLGRLPLVLFDTTDDIPARLARRAGVRSLTATPHLLPSTDGYLAAIRAGLGWGAVPEVQAAPLLDAGDLVDVADGHHVDVALHWQHWRTMSGPLQTLTDAVVATAAERLHPA